MSELTRVCGRLIVGGFDGDTLPTAVASALRKGHRGGAILFRQNLPALAAAHSLCCEITRAAAAGGHAPLIGIDEESRRVHRLPTPAIELPTMRALGERDDAEGVRRLAAALGEELRAIGFNVDFAPVLDVDSNPANPIIGDRSFGPDPDRVARLGIAFATGLQSSGVLACGKHFPGHGDTLVDSHLDLPAVDHPLERLQRMEIEPFRKAARSLGSMMSAHVVYTALDEQPATLSHAIATTLLRDELGFSGVLFSDDLEMRALADRHPIEESSVLAVAAGCDALLVCHDLELQDRAHAALVREAERSEAFRSRCAQAAARLAVAAARHPARPVAALALTASIEAARSRFEIALA